MLSNYIQIDFQCQQYLLKKNKKLKKNFTKIKLLVRI